MRDLGIHTPPCRPPPVRGRLAELFDGGPHGRLQNVETAALSLGSLPAKHGIRLGQRVV